jgi:hypothetical protein
MAALFAGGGLFGLLASLYVDPLARWASRRVIHGKSPLDVEADPYFYREYLRDENRASSEPESPPG